MNWTVDDNGAYDYAADTRGCTMGLLAALPHWELGNRELAFHFCSLTSAILVSPLQSDPL
jgi:hypothetical protein